ncbi:MAG: CapA family protein, partial [Pseudomonadota bacterium]
MLGTDFPTDRLPANDASILTGAAERLRAADVAFGNLEGVLLDGGEPFKVCKDPSLCYLFRTPSRYVQHLADAGFDVLSLANNHSRDFGEDGRDATMPASSSVCI